MEPNNEIPVQEAPIIDRISPIIDALMRGDSHLSYSSLTAFMDGPRKFIDYKLGVREETDAMLFGQMLHCLVLEPQEFDKRYFCLNDEDKVREIGGGNPRATKLYKEWRAEQVGTIGDRTIVEGKDYMDAKRMAGDVRNNRASAKILDLCWEHEKPINWEFMNFKFRGFIDGDGEKDTMDLKMVPDAEPKKAQRQISNMWYYGQAAMYLHGNTKEPAKATKNYHIVCVDKKGGVSVHTLSEALIKHGMEEYTHFVAKFNECIIKEAWDQSHDFFSLRWDGLFQMEKAAWMY